MYLILHSKTRFLSKNWCSIQTTTNSARAFLCPTWYFPISLSLLYPILIGVKHIVLICICISLSTNALEHVFICLLNYLEFLFCKSHVPYSSPILQLCFLSNFSLFVCRHSHKEKILYPLLALDIADIFYPSCHWSFNLVHVVLH